MNINKFFALLFALCLISCSDEKDLITGEKGDNKISFSVGISSVINTRVSTNSEFKTTFDNNDVIGIFIYSRNEGEEPSIDENELYVKNIKLSNINGNWELERPVYYADRKKILDIYAYYPYKDNADVHSMEYNADKEMVELLMASSIGTRKSDNVIKLQFKHMQSLVHITLTKDYNVPNFDNNLNVYFNGVIGGKYSNRSSSFLM